MFNFKGKSSPEFSIFVMQISVVAVLTVTATVIKFAGGNFYNDVRTWYAINFNSDTSISEVISEDTVSDAEPPTVVEEITPEQNSSQANTGTDSNVTDNSIATPEKLSVTTGAVVNGEISRAESNNTLCRPVSGATVTSEYGERVNPITDEDEIHKGMDLAVASGTDIYAAAAGEVELARYSSTYGNYIIINHGGKLKTLYAHCSKLSVSAGDRVEKGQVIAKVGSTGRSTGPHLHFEVILDGENINPNWVVKW